MNYTVTKVDSRQSKMGDIFYYVFLKSDEGKSARTCIYPKFRNYQFWKPAIDAARNDKAVYLKNLREMKNGMVDADSLATSNILIDNK